ncbi:hypothetical protein AtNW77_Chr3g0171031 [Arabidopsis thaliana]|uniref:Uncharacterized protein n=2 Tax=Arabidopsis TaxID=3701 RepID=A0A178V8I9_ARATH|nr:hypothetical protein ISN45_At03g014780 [Arabidopsis thaliana x Arabidopsis arenosa]OAP01313.1 hypothetical protein AXX17_AT3G15090 [Arabidopsis thaliana]
MSDLVIALVAFDVLFVVFIILSCIMGGETDAHSPPPLPRPGQLRMPVYRTKDKDLGGDGTAISVAGTDIYGGSGGHGGRGIITSDTKLPSPPPPSPLPPRPVQRPKPVSRTKDRELIDTGTANTASSLLTSGSASSCSGGGSHGHRCGGGGGGGGGGCGGGGCGGGGCGG